MFSPLRNFRLVSVSIFLLGMVTASMIYYSRFQAEVGPLPLGFTLVQNKTFVARTGQSPYRYGAVTRHQRSDGSFREETSFLTPTGEVERVDVQFRRSTGSLFRVDEKNRVLAMISPAASRSAAQMSQLMKNGAEFQREEYVSGFRTLVSRIPQGKSGEYRELYYSPDLNAFLKTLSVAENGTNLTEPTSITLGEPGSDIFSSIPNYPVGYEHMSLKIQQAEKWGNTKLAEALKQQVKEAQLARSPSN